MALVCFYNKLFIFFLYIYIKCFAKKPSQHDDISLHPVQGLCRMLIVFPHCPSLFFPQSPSSAFSSLPLGGSRGSVSGDSATPPTGLFSVSLSLHNGRDWARISGHVCVTGSDNGDTVALLPSRGAYSSSCRIGEEIWGGKAGWSVSSFSPGSMALCVWWESLAGWIFRSGFGSRRWRRTRLYPSAGPSL